MRLNPQFHTLYTQRARAVDTNAFGHGRNTALNDFFPVILTSARQNDVQGWSLQSQGHLEVDDQDMEGYNLFVYLCECDLLSVPGQQHYTDLVYTVERLTINWFQDAKGTKGKVNMLSLAIIIKLLAATFFISTGAALGPQYWVQSEQEFQEMISNDRFLYQITHALLECLSLSTVCNPLEHPTEKQTQGSIAELLRLFRAEGKIFHQSLVFCNCFYKLFSSIFS